MINKKVVRLVTFDKYYFLTLHLKASSGSTQHMLKTRKYQHVPVTQR